MRLLAISGSLRRRSSNTAALLAAARLAPPGVEIHLFDALGTLPHFNPDLDAEGDEPPQAVAAWRSLVSGSDGMLLSTPEYAHGLPGSFKNALDWLVSSPVFYGKPVAIINTSPQSTHAQASLIEILSTMGTRLVREAFVELPLRGRHLDAEGIVQDGELVAPLRSAIEVFIRALNSNGPDATLRP